MQVIITLNNAESMPLAPVMGRSAISYVIASFSPKWKLIFAVNEKFKNTELESEIKKHSEDAVVSYVPETVRGSSDAVSAVLHLLDPDDSVAVTRGDLAMTWNADAFEKFVANSSCNLSVVSLTGFHPSQLGPSTYLFLKVDEDTRTVTKFKQNLSFGTNIEKEWMVAGFYYFRSVGLLKQGFEIKPNRDVENEDKNDISFVVNALIFDRKISALNYPISHYLQLSSPEDIEFIGSWYKFIVVENKKSQFETDSVEAKVHSYFKYLFRRLSR
ncbi:MAG: hypothetical protein H7256_08245 [Bdellovibrio sp.]|nr:hypothetical protein [Bdellovibrio sp.]